MPGMPRGQASKKPKKQGDSWFVAWAKVAEKLADKFGVAGFFLIFCCFFVSYYASEEQKRRIIETYVLWKEPHPTGVFFIYIGVAVVLFVAQNYYFRQQRRADRDEINRLSQWKSEQQAKALQQPTHSTKKKGIGSP